MTAEIFMLSSIDPAANARLQEASVNGPDAFKDD